MGPMAEEEIKESRIEKFDETNFGYWMMQIEDYRYGKKLHFPLLGKKSKDMVVVDWNLFNKHVLSVIRLILSRSVAHNVTKEKTVAELMATLLRCMRSRQRTTRCI